MTDNQSEDDSDKRTTSGAEISNKNGNSTETEPADIGDDGDHDSDDDGATIILTEALPHFFTTILSSGSAKTAQLPESLDRALTGVVTLKSKIRADGRTTAYLGDERAGSGLIIDPSGLILTIGYLIVEAEEITVSAESGGDIPADPIGYDHDSGFGLVRAREPLRAYPMTMGDSAAVSVKDPVLVASGGGRAEMLGAFAVSRRPFAGYWEYMLDDALFTSPPHQNWGGAALFNLDGELVGVGSLLVEDAGLAAGKKGDRSLPGNMFVPINLFKPILSTLVETGGNGKPGRPWLGVFSAEASGRVVVAHTADDGPAAAAGIKSEDQIIKVNGVFVDTLPAFYNRLWNAGPAGCEINLTILRNNVAFDLPIATIDRLKYLRMGFGS